MTIIAGVEEAGRGPVIGPMVMCIATIDKKDEPELKKIGVKDSKLLTPGQRTTIANKLKKILLDYKIEIIEPIEIDSALQSDTLNLNWLEAVTTAKLIHAVKCDKVILDCPSTNIKAYEQYIKKLLNKDVELIAEHKADVNHLIVGAASIIAKVNRDNEIKKIKKKYKLPDFGSGYPADPKTVEFLEENYDKYPIFRKTWESYKRIVRAKDQKTLSEF